MIAGFLLTLVLVLVGDDANKSTPPLPNVLARIDGDDATLAEYQRWLVEVQGASLLNQFLDERILLKAAADAGCTVPSAEVDSAFETLWNTNVKQRFKGNEAGFIDELRTAGQTRDTWAIAKKHEILSDMTLDRLCRHARDVSDAALAARFTRDYGDPARRLSVRAVRINSFTLEQERVRRGEPRSTSPQEVADRAAKLATDLWTRISKGEEIGAIAKEFSHDSASAPNGGLIEHLTEDRFGAPVRDAARALDKDHPLAPLVKDGLGFTILRFESSTPVAIDAVKDDLKKAIQDDPVAGSERSEMYEKLRSAVKIERLFKP